MKAIEPDTDYFHALKDLPKFFPFDYAEIHDEHLNELLDRGAVKRVGEDQFIMTLRGAKAMEYGKVCKDQLKSEAEIRNPKKDELVFNYTCPICDETGLVVASHESERQEAVAEKMVEHHELEELQKHYYAREIVTDE